MHPVGYRVPGILAMSKDYNSEDNGILHDSDNETSESLKRRVFCQARGLSQDHNAHTAFFDIPVIAPHGLLLVCSNTECADSQRRFRYCRVCAKPVSRQNFSKRHGHGLLNGLKKRDKKADLADLGSCLETLPKLDGIELASFFHWIQNNDDVF